MNLRKVVFSGLLLVLVGAAALVALSLSRRSANEPAPPSVQQLLAAADTPGPAEVDQFLAEYNTTYRMLWTAAEGSAWDANTDISEASTQKRIEANQNLGDYVGSRLIIEQLREYRARHDLSPLQERQLEVAWQLAAHYPGTSPATVESLITAEALQNEKLYAFTYRLQTPGRDTRTVTPNEIDELLQNSRNLEERLAVWQCSKEVGPSLQDGLATLQQLRNAVALEMGYTSFFGLEVADYGMSSREMLTLMDELIDGIAPLYRQLHCWVKHELAVRYGVAVPRRIPAHWVGNRWAQEWPGIVQGIDLDSLFQGRNPQWIVEQAERFYTSLGFANLPVTFWGRSDLFELPAGATRKKNTHASAWHIDLDQDVRSLMSVTANYRWFTTTHHELGHIYYYLAYSRPEVPSILRTGANRAFHEGIGTLIELASNQIPYFVQVGLLQEHEAPEQIRWLLSQALLGPVVFIPFACGTMTHWEYDFYEQGLTPEQYNARWWQYAGQYQGIDAPGERGAEFCDPATKTHINNDPAQYYDYAVSHVILHQLHRHICRNILKTDVRSANYYGSQSVGMYLQSILELGATRDWQQVMRDATGQELSSQAMIEYFQPLLEWLQQENAGRDVQFD